MRGPEGPVRGGVTRCGRPPPRLRGRGRGKTSRLSTLSRVCLPWTIVPAGRLSRAMLASISQLPVACAFERKRPVNVAVVRTSSRPRVISATRGIGRKSTEGGRNESANDAARAELIVRGSVWRRSSCSSGFCADIGVPGERRLWLVVRSTAPGRSGPGTGRCAGSRPARRRPSRRTTASHTPRRPLERCGTCHPSRRRLGVAPSWRTLCRQPAPRRHRNRTRVSRGTDVPTSRG